MRDFVAQSESPVSLPNSIDIFVNENLLSVSESDREQLLNAYVTFNLAYGDFGRSDINTSFVIVMDLYGEVMSVLSGPEFDHRGAVRHMRYEGLKCKSENVLLLGGRTTDAAGSKFFEWDFNEAADARAILPKGVNGSSHDIQFLSPTITGKDMYAFISLSLDTVVVCDSDGNKIWSYSEPPGTDSHYNHVQFTSSTATAEMDTLFISARDLSTVKKVLYPSGELVWALGGYSGTLTITDSEGVSYPAGSDYFYHQHNAEYIGNNRIALFDNNYDGDEAVGNSRVLVFEVNESEGSATVLWEWDVGCNSPVFGDADLMPSGADVIVVVVIVSASMIVML